MNILIISPNSPYESTGGIERYIANFIRYVSAHEKHRFIFLLPKHHSEENFSRGQHQIIFTPGLAVTSIPNYKQRDISLAATSFSSTLENIIDEFEINIIVADNFHLGVPAALSLRLSMVAGLKKVPVTLQLHSFANKPLQIEIVNQLPWKKIFCVSQSVAGDSFQKGADVDLLETHYLGVDYENFSTTKKSQAEIRESFGIDADCEVVLCASRLILGHSSILKEKGIINLLKAAAKLKEHRPNVHILIATAKPPIGLLKSFENVKERLFGYIQLYGLTGRVTVKAFSMDEMPEAYRASDLFVLPSENETFGQVFIEAMTSGIPVIGTKVGGIPEIINDNVNGFLVPPRDETLLAQKIEMLLTDESLRSEFVAKAKEKIINQFVLETQLDNFVATLEGLVSEYNS